MKVRPGGRWIAAAVALAMVLAACADDDGEPEVTDPVTEDDPDDDAVDDDEVVAEPEGDPITIGGTLALTGVFAATAEIHEIVAEEYVGDKMFLNVSSKP
jgi:hypothetical protein